MQERRRFKRFEEINFLRFKPQIFSVHVDSITKNISLNGACFFSDNQLKKNKIINLEFFYNSNIPLRKIKARVIYSLSISDKFGKSYLNGVEFLE